MKTCPRLSLLSITFLFLITLAVTSTFAATKKITPPPPIDTRTLVAAIDPKAGTITIRHMRDKSVNVYTIDSLTAVTIDNSKGTFAGIKTGMQVQSSIERDGHTLDSVSITMAALGPVAPKKH